MPDLSLRASRPAHRPTVVALLALGTLLTMSAWFSATAVVPRLRTDWDLGAGGVASLTIAVQVGFVLGALGTAVTGLADAVAPRRLVLVGSWTAAACTAGLLLCDGLAAALPLRAATGAALALVYPPAVREVAAWVTRGRGLALGVMIGALTLGSALPHLVQGVDLGAGWRPVVAATAVLTALGGVVVLAVRGTAPGLVLAGERRPVSLRAGLASLRHRRVLLADLGYVGHMWELYAMWAGVASLLASLPGLAGGDGADRTVALLAFGCIGVGALGCLVGGVLSDRWGRERAAGLALVCSGATALLLAVGHARWPVGVVVALCAVWGFWVIADSAQFSALVTEAAPPEGVGAALAVQLALGYSTTVLTLWLVPTVVAASGWGVALLLLALGPAAGAVAMARLHGLRSPVA
ncbi:MFS transporter [Nocardioides bruguierae]|uniref:MFS transporter n=1 Tax=Nocardioides bruguierae TaxID=2945102 RepID=A0A9X2D9Q6_9ACTN|nr:MFS transporter [Nocardioides bruguierae]MCM0621882.1 MFS transporter [Nocardioides bruguierae]